MSFSLTDLSQYLIFHAYSTFAFLYKVTYAIGNARETPDMLGYRMRS